MKSNIYLNESFRNLKLFFDFLRLGDLFFGIFELFDLAVRMGLCRSKTGSQFWQ
jgi:hypothetical protein